MTKKGFIVQTWYYTLFFSAIITARELMLRATTVPMAISSLKTGIRTAVLAMLCECSYPL